MNPKHHLRFIQALALAAALPGCAGSAESSPADEADAQPTDAQDANALATPARGNAMPARGNATTARSNATPAVDAATPAVDAATDVDARRPFSSGPIVPPELSVGFA